MKYINIILVCTVLAFSSCNDSINSEDKRNADWVWSEDESGNKGQWVPVGNDNNVQNGYVTSFYDNGNTCEKTRIINNEKIDTTWYYDFNENDKLIKIYVNIDGIESWTFPINGPYKRYYQSGTVHEEGFISNFQKGYFYNVYAEDGSIIYREINDTLLNKSSYSNYYQGGIIKDTTITINGLQEETSIHWFENGEMEHLDSWKNGERNGVIKSFYPDGQLETITFAKNGIRDSSYLKYYESGTLKMECIYDNGEINGNLNKYFPNGQIEDSITFNNGKQEGPFFKFYDSGEKYFEGQLTNGKVSGTWFYSDGKIFSTCFYKENSALGLITYYTKSNKQFLIEK